MTYQFKYTNNQYFLKGSMGFFLVVAGIVLINILINFESFMETHAFETIALFIFAIVIGFSLFAGKKGKQLKSDVKLSGNSLSTKYQYFSLDKLKLYEFSSEHYEAYFLVHTNNNFALYTNQKDDLIKQLLLSNIEKESHGIEDYKFKRGSSTVTLVHNDGNEFSFDLDTGKFSFNNPETDEKPTFYLPENFIQTPNYKLISS